MKKRWEAGPRHRLEPDGRWSGALLQSYEFREALAFVTNYGRDNDTVAAITGAVLGAHHGFNAIPDDLKNPVLTTSKEQLGIDLESLADEVVSIILMHSPVEFEE